MARARRGRGEGSVFQRKSDGYWIVRVPGRDEFGNPARRQLGARRTKTAALELLAKHAASPATAIAKGSVAEFLARWLRDVAADRVDPGTLRQYNDHVQLRIVPAIGKIGLGSLDPPRIATFYRSMAAARVGASTRNKVHAVLRTAFETAVDWGLVASNPFLRVPPPRYEPPERPTLDLAHARRLLELIADDRLGAVYAIALSMGLRQGEIFGLQWDDLDLDRAILTLRHNLQEGGGRMRLKGLKRRRQRRELPLPRLALDALRRRRGAAIDEGRDVERGYVFCSANGKPVHKSNFYRDSWDPLRRALGLPPNVRLHFHDLRHTLGMLQRQSGADLETRRQQLGHASVKITADVYGHSIPAQLVAAARAVDAMLSPRTVAPERLRKTGIRYSRRAGQRRSLLLADESRLKEA